MTSEKFGVIELIRDECPKGTILREDEYGVTLEECLDNNEKNVDVLIHFPKSCTLKNKEDLYNCLVEARKHESDLTKPIYIKIPYESSEPTETENKEEEAAKRAHMERVIERSGTHPWNFRVF